MAGEKTPGAQPKELSSLGRIYKELEAGDIDGMFENTCEGCAVKEACVKASVKCNALAVIAVMAIDRTIGPMAPVVASLYTRDLKEAIASIKK